MCCENTAATGLSYAIRESDRPINGVSNRSHHAGFDVVRVNGKVADASWLVADYRGGSIQRLDLNEVPSSRLDRVGERELAVRSKDGTGWSLDRVPAIL